MKMLSDQLAHDYDGELAKKYFERITVEFYPLFVKLQERVRKYYEEPCLRETMAFYTKGWSMRKEQKVIFGGRLGEYKYYDMDAVIASALELAEKELD